MHTLTRSQEPDAETRRKLWLAVNEGVLRRIADDAGASPAYVSDILSGKRAGDTELGRKVRRLLKKHGAPGFAE
jgi:hypothetical protein